MSEEYSYFGKYKIIDGHTHIYGPMYQEDPEVELEVRGLKKSSYGREFPYSVLTAEDLVAHMKRFDIHKFVAFAGHWHRSDVVYDTSYHIPNGYIAEAQKKYPDNIIGFGRVQPNYKGKAEEEARRCFEELGLKGLKVQPNCEWISMGDTERWGPIMELLAEYDYPLLAHSRIHWYICSPGRFFTLAEAFPDVKIIMSHGAFRYAHDAMMVAKHCDNIYLGTSNWSEYNIWKAVEMGLEDRMVFSTDTPQYTPGWTVLRHTSNPKLTEEQKIKILGGNLARILKIKF